MRYMQDIRNYGEDIADFELSPFESLDLLHLRSKLHSVYDDMTLQEKRALSMYDLKLIANASEMLKHLQKAYDFSLSKEPIKEWWWHLDKLVNGDIQFIAQNTRDYAL